MPVRTPQGGFTLMELVIAVVLVGIIVLGIGSYVQFGVQGYVNTVSRERFQSELRFALEKMTREIRHAAPNSVSASVLANASASAAVNKGAAGENCVAFRPIVAAGFYVGAPDATPLQVVPTIGSLAQWLALKDSQYAVAVGLVNASEYGTQSHQIVDVTDSENTQPLQVTLAQPLTTSSPAQRVYVYGGRVRYCLVGQALMREEGRVSLPVANHVDAFSVTALSAGLENNGMVHLRLRSHDPRSGESFHYDHTVQVLNVR